MASDHGNAGRRQVNIALWAGIVNVVTIPPPTWFAILDLRSCIPASVGGAALAFALFSVSPSEPA